MTNTASAFEDNLKCPECGRQLIKTRRGDGSSPDAIEYLCIKCNARYTLEGGDSEGN